MSAEWESNGRRLPGSGGEAPPRVTVGEVLDRYDAWAEGQYRRPDGTHTSRLGNVRAMIKLVREFYGRTEADAFGATALRTLQRIMVKRGQRRRTVNARVAMIRALFVWASRQDLITASLTQVRDELGKVESLKAHRIKAPESKSVRPVADEDIAKVIERVPGPVAGLIRLQLLTGARAGELIELRPVDLDTSGDVWVTKPMHHKTAHRNRERVIYFGPKAQAGRL